MKGTAWWVVLGIILLLVLGYVIACVFVFRFAFLRDKISKRDRFDPNHPSKDPWFSVVADGIAYAKTLPREEVSIRSRDGLSLYGMLFEPKEQPRATIILFHGYRSFPEHDFGGILQHYLEDCRFRMLLIDHRAHGKSEGKYITFGVREKDDCVDWARYIADRYGRKLPIILDGMSMGATTVMMASGEDLPGNTVGIIADCGYTTPNAILRKVGREMRMPVWLLLPGVYTLCALHGFNPLAASAPRALAKNSLPILIVHGEADGFVPHEMGVENFAAAGGHKKFLSIPDADHGMSYFVDKPAVTAALHELFDLILPLEQSA
ncbi:MAG: alpha/beta hydrolase [Clostridia bacterium]|nr:alpha/beta hydrolase [Clostridia bacterium]MBQ8859654.1 alpha/beta hydrolase [Clostridia bacterium]